LNESTATRYQRLRRSAQVVSLSVGAIWLLVVSLTPLGRTTAAWAESLSADWAFLIFVLTLVVVWEAVALPAGVVAAVRSERRFRRGRLAVSTLVANQLRDALIGIVNAVAGASVVWWSLTSLSVWWWLAVGALGAPILLIMTALAGMSVRVAPGSRPLARQVLADRLSRLAEQACGRRVPVLEWNDPAAVPTALVTGVGRSGAILLSREMVADWSDDEIAVVVAHELSHHARHDLWRKAALDTGVLLVVLWVADVVVAGIGPALGVPSQTSLTALPLIALCTWLLWWVWRPLRLAQSRAHERVADRFAITLTGDPEAFRTAVRRLAAQHLAEERPSTLTRWFFHRHPTPEERIKNSVTTSATR
jgi:STE24 endopeptidase